MTICGKWQNVVRQLNFAMTLLVKLLVSILCLLLFQSCKISYDLQIVHAKVFDTKRGIVLDDRSIIINADTIVAVVKGNERIKARRTINASGKLVIPGIVDAHVHSTHSYGDYDAAPKFLKEDSLEFFRKKFSDNYLPYGVTTVMVMGQPETWLKPILDWSAHPSPDFTNIYTTGGALISKEDRKPYIGHVTVDSPLAARQKVMDYYKMGIRHIKLYWRLRRPEFWAAFKTADSLGMRVYGHVDNGIMEMKTTMEIGLKNYEHIFTILHSIAFSQEDEEKFVGWMDSTYGKGKGDSLKSFEALMSEARFILDKKPAALDSLIDRLAKGGASFSTTIHLIADDIGLLTLPKSGHTPDSGLSEGRRQHNSANFKAFMLIAKKCYDKGIKLRIGTDCPDGGKAALSEQLLLFEYGFSIPSIIQISTINGAEALGLSDTFGVIETGKKADLLIYDESPFDNYKNFLSNKTILKDGKIFPGTVSK